MPIINSITDKRRSALYIVLRFDFEYHLLSDADLFARVADLGYFWDETALDWRAMQSEATRSEPPRCARDMPPPGLPTAPDLAAQRGDI